MDIKPIRLKVVTSDDTRNVAKIHEDQYPAFSKVPYCQVAGFILRVEPGGDESGTITVNSAMYEHVLKDSTQYVYPFKEVKMSALDSVRFVSSDPSMSLTDDLLESIDGLPLLRAQPLMCNAGVVRPFELRTDGHYVMQGRFVRGRTQCRLIDPNKALSSTKSVAECADDVRLFLLSDAPLYSILINGEDDEFVSKLSELSRVPISENIDALNWFGKPATEIVANVRRAVRNSLQRGICILCIRHIDLVYSRTDFKGLADISNTISSMSTRPKKLVFVAIMVSIKLTRPKNLVFIATTNNSDAIPDCDEYNELITVEK